MDQDRMDELAGAPRFISGIYNYCDRWCERCGFTSRCMNYALGEGESVDSRSRAIKNEAFGDKLHEIFETTMEMVEEDADGSAKVALIGIERSIAAWATLLRRFPDHEDALVSLATLRRLLRQVEAAFPSARAFRRPGFDARD